MAGEYGGSVEGQFLAFMDSHRRHEIIAEMERLVGTGYARQGKIFRAYVSSDDNPRRHEFSVEVRIDIDGKHGVVTHAHCDEDGEPKADTACHFKLANEKYGGDELHAFGTVTCGAAAVGGDDHGCAARCLVGCGV
ncbi:MAG: hypothetical protein WDN04_05070 [Rhodospirillales bacterium]